VTSIPQDGAQPPPTLFAWAGGAEALSRLTRTFYGHVRDDPILAPVFAGMSPMTWSGVWLAARTRKAMSSWQRRSICREERTPMQEA
jgi:truncated hemoglobin YjbI